MFTSYSCHKCFNPLLHFELPQYSFLVSLSWLIEYITAVKVEMKMKWQGPPKQTVQNLANWIFFSELLCASLFYITLVQDNSLCPVASNATEETPCEAHWQICLDLAHEVVTGQAVKAFFGLSNCFRVFCFVFPYFLIKKHRPLDIILCKE